MRKITLNGFLATLILLIAGCGGGGGGTTVSDTNNKPLQPTAAVIHVSSRGAVPETVSIGSIGVTIELPAGVTVKHDSTGAIEPGVIEVSGVASGKAIVGLSVYQPATAGNKGRVSFTVMAQDRAIGYGTGEFATVHCDIASNSSVTATDFSLVQFDPFDLARSAAIPTGPDGLQASFDAILQ